MFPCCVDDGLGVSASVSQVFAAGMKVLACWTDCRFYPAKILSVNRDGEAHALSERVYAAVNQASHVACFRFLQGSFLRWRRPDGEAHESQTLPGSKQSATSSIWPL